MKDSQECIWKNQINLKIDRIFLSQKFISILKLKKNQGLHSLTIQIYFLHEKIAEEMELVSLQMISI